VVVPESDCNFKFGSPLPPTKRRLPNHTRFAMPAVD
jgi:hypothetical protein